MHAFECMEMFILIYIVSVMSRKCTTSPLHHITVFLLLFAILLNLNCHLSPYASSSVPYRQWRSSWVKCVAGSSPTVLLLSPNPQLSSSSWPASLTSQGPSIFLKHTRYGTDTCDGWQQHSKPKYMLLFEWLYCEAFGCFCIMAYTHTYTGLQFNIRSKGWYGLLFK